MHVLIFKLPTTRGDLTLAGRRGGKNWGEGKSVVSILASLKRAKGVQITHCVIQQTKGLRGES